MKFLKYIISLLEYKIALDILEKTGESKGQGITCFNLGVIYDILGNKTHRNRYFKRASEIFRKEGMKKVFKYIKEWS